MTGPVSMWQSARSLSDSGFASDVRKSASRKSAQVTSRKGLKMRPSVLPKNSRVSCNHFQMCLSDFLRMCLSEGHLTM